MTLKRKILRVSKGQISPDLVERTDINILDASGQKILNFYNSKYGAIKTALGSKLVNTWAGVKKIKLQKIKLANLTEGFIAFNGTDHTIAVFNNKAELLSNTATATWLTEANVSKIILAQNQDMILVATGDNPIIRINIDNLAAITSSVFSIPMSDIMKSANITTPALSPILVRMGNQGLPANPANVGIEVGTLVYPNSGTNNPNTSFPWNVQRLDRIGSLSDWLITKATINNAGDIAYWLLDSATIDSVGDGNYVAGEIVQTADGRTWKLPETIAVGQALIPQEADGYATDPSGTNQPTTGGSGTGLTISRTATGYTGYQEGDVIETENGAQFTITDVSAGAQLTINNPDAIYNSNPAGTDIPVVGDGGNGMTIDIEAANTTNIWTPVSYTAANGDIIRDLFNSTFWAYSGTSWTRPSNSSDITYQSQWYNSALSGVVKITARNNGVLFSITAPAGINPTAYAQGILYGMTFDGQNALGLLQIQSITGTVSGQRYDVKTIDGLTIVSFDRNYTNDNPATGFIIKFSEQPVFSGDRPFTNANPTEQTNYPTSILFYQQRLIIGGTNFNRSQMIFSELGKYNSFKDEYYNSSAFQLIIGSTEKEEIRRITLNQGIQIFTSNNEWLMNDQAITRNSGFIRNSSIGTSGVEPVIAANGTTLFVPKNGKGLIGFTYNFQSASYSTPYISLFTDLLDSGIVDICQKRGLDSTDDTLLYIAMEDGSLVIGNYLQEHEIQAFCKKTHSPGTHRQTIQCDDQVIFLVDRNGQTGLELVDETKYTEAVPYSFTYNPGTGILTLTNAPSYNGQALNVYDGNRKFIGEYTVENGMIVFPDDEAPAAVSEVGYNIHSEFISNPQNINAQTKTIYKSITAIRLALTTVSNPEYLKIEGKSASWVKDNLAEYRRLIRPTRDARFKITNDRYPVEILSMEIEIEA